MLAELVKLVLVVSFSDNLLTATFRDMTTLSTPSLGHWSLIWSKQFIGVLENALCM